MLLCLGALLSILSKALKTESNDTSHGGAGKLGLTHISLMTAEDQNYCRCRGRAMVGYSGIIGIKERSFGGCTVPH